MNYGARSKRAEARALLWIYGVLALTSLHHVYGAIHYATPWRYHAVQLSAVALGVILAAYWLSHGKLVEIGRVAHWVFLGVSWIVPVLFIGGFEGVYNHVAKDALYFGGLSEAWMVQLFPPPTYEMPNDLLFEATGVLQVVPAGLAAYHLVDFMRGARNRSTSRAARR